MTDAEIRVREQAIVWAEASGRTPEQILAAQLLAVRTPFSGHEDWQWLVQLSIDELAALVAEYEHAPKRGKKAPPRGN